VSRSHMKFFGGRDLPKLEAEIERWLGDDEKIHVIMFDTRMTRVAQNSEGDVYFLFIFAWHIHEPMPEDYTEPVGRSHHPHEFGEDDEDDTKIPPRKKTTKSKKPN